MDKCSWEHDVTLDGLKGSVATGPNGNSIFIPYAGSRRGTFNPYLGGHASIWSGDTGFAHEPPSEYPYNYIDLDVNLPNGSLRFDGDICSDGQSIRPVFDEDDSTTTDVVSIETFRNFQSEKVAIYNLHGQRLHSLQRGLNIFDGKKVMK